MIIEYPQLPQCKIYNAKSRLTPEQEVTFKLIQEKEITLEEENILKDAISFYEVAFDFLKSIDLSNITDKQANELISFVNKVFNHYIVVQNVIYPEKVFRVTPVLDEFLVDGKVRSTDFIKYPPLSTIKEKGIYGRANTPNSTYFYCAISSDIALLETQPKMGQRILISVWENLKKSGLVAYPICDHSIPNEGANKGKKSIEERLSFNHPLFAQIFRIQLAFLNSEFIKKCEMKSKKNYEWLYSAIFADRILQGELAPIPHKTEPINPYDCIIFPSVAYLHETDNLAIKPSTVDKHLIPTYIEDCKVFATNYDNFKQDGKNLPIVRGTYRKSKAIKNGNIIWDDD